MLSLLVIGMTLAFTLSKIGRHRRVLSRRIIWLDFYFKQISFPAPPPNSVVSGGERGSRENKHRENVEKSIAIIQVSINHGWDQ